MCENFRNNVASTSHLQFVIPDHARCFQGFVDISNTWSPKELEPYKILFGDGYADMVMVGHLYHKDYAGQGSGKLPASVRSGIVL